MTELSSSSDFTKIAAGEQPFGPPLIGALLRMPWEAVQRRMLEHLHERGFDDLDAAHLIVFQYPGPHDMRPSELADRLRISKQALGYLLGQLEQLGYLERRPDPHDQRGKRILVTRRGASAIATIRDAVAEMEAKWGEQLGPKRFTQLRELLHDLNQPA
jgi:DNA-binding MarR family transcriptional regulator